MFSVLRSSGTALLLLAVVSPGLAAAPPVSAPRLLQDLVQGELLVQLTPQAASSLLPNRAADRTGIAGLDLRLEALRASSFEPVFDNHLDPEGHRLAGLDRIYRVRFASSIALDEATRRLVGPEFVYVEPDRACRALDVLPNDPLFPSQWSHRNTNLSFVPDCDTDDDSAWNYTQGSNDLIVAILDTGIDLTHPEFAGRLVPGFDYHNNDNNPTDDNGHGTSCAGIAAASGNNGEGIAGVAWNVRIMPLKVLGVDGNGAYTPLAQAITFAADNGARVLSMSLGGGTPPTTLLNAVNYAYTTKGCLLFAATGNDDINGIEYPAFYANVAAVGACSPCNQRKTFNSCDGENWWGSNYGNDLDFLAPGVLIQTTDITGTDGYANGNYFSLFNGTSSATPHAAGVAALIWSYKPSLTNTEVWNLMRNTAEDLGSAGWDIWTGWGRINAANAIESLLFADATVDPLGSSSSGAGVAWGDYDADGDPDLYLSRSDAPNQLFRNDAGTFVDATVVPLEGVGGGQGAIWGDYDNDGDLDLYLGNDGADQLLRNDSGAFSDVTEGALSDNSHTTGVNWVDYDNDGDLDLYRSNYDDANRLLRNDGGAGFVEVPSTPLNNSLPTICSAWGDYDNDGDQDVYFTNEGANRMVRNNGDGTFSGASSAPLNDANFGRGCAWGDFDNDGDLDLFLANVDAPSRLFRNNGGGSFTDVAAGPLAVPSGTVGCAWGDYDNDGDLDLFLSREGAPSHLMRNEGGYWSISQKSGVLANVAIGRGCAWSDYDRDGDLDLYVANAGSSNRLIRNDRLSAPSWLEVRLVGSQTNRGAVGARVSVKADGVWRMREVSAGANYLSMNDATLHFGLAAAAAIDSVAIRWTNSPEQHLTGVGLNQVLVVNEGGGTVDAADLPPVSRPAEPRFVGAPSPNPFTASSAIRFRLAVAGPASLRLYAADGRLVRTLLTGHADPGDYTLHWNGTADDGRPAPAGIYFARLLQGDREVSERLVRLE